MYRNNWYNIWQNETQCIVTSVHILKCVVHFTFHHICDISGNVISLIQNINTKHNHKQECLYKIQVVAYVIFMCRFI